MPFSCYGDGRLRINTKKQSTCSPLAPAMPSYRPDWHAKANGHQFSECWKENASPIITPGPIRPMACSDQPQQESAGSHLLGPMGQVGVFRRLVKNVHRRRGFTKDHNYVTIRGDNWERESRQRTKLNAGDPSYRQDPRRVVPVSNPLKHPELHSLIHTVTHLGGLETWGQLYYTFKDFVRDHW